MSKSSNKYNIQVAVAVDSPHASLRQSTYQDNLNSLPNNVNNSEQDLSLLHTVKEVTDIQLPSISKDSYETTDINDDAGVRKYQGGLVDGGEFSFTTESYVDDLESQVDDLTTRAYSSNTAQQQTYYNDFPFQLIDINGNPMNEGLGGDNNSGWETDTGGGLDIHGGNSNPTTYKYFEFSPVGATEGADTVSPTSLKLNNVFRSENMRNKVYTFGYQIHSHITLSDVGLDFKLQINDNNNSVFNLEVGKNSGRNVVTTKINRLSESSLHAFLTTNGAYTHGGKLGLMNVFLVRYYNWEDLCKEDTTVFFKINDDTTQRMLFEARITGVEVEAPIDGVIRKTITAKVTGGIS